MCYRLKHFTIGLCVEIEANSVFSVLFEAKHIRHISGLLCPIVSLGFLLLVPEWHATRMYFFLRYIEDRSHLNVDYRNQYLLRSRVWKK